MNPNVITPKDQLHELITFQFLSSRLRTHGGRPGEVLQLFAEDSPQRQRLRELKSDDIADAPYFTYVFSAAPGAPGARRGRMSTDLRRCSVPGCTFTRPKMEHVTDDGTCLLHRRKS